MPVIPACVGTFETGDPQCNGDPSDPAPCTWRDKCGAFKTYLDTQSSNGSQWFDSETGELRADTETFNRFCLEQIQKFSVVGGQPRIPQEEQMPTLAQIANVHELRAHCTRCDREIPLSLLLSELFEAALEELAAGKPVVIRGLGTLKRERFKGRGLAKEAGDRWIIRFKAAPKAKQYLNQRST